ncbi:hypothetical protein BJI67_07400 [Acidihalobacter aeolianus]|uniref:Xcc1710-like domain-containing protein n=1 Tax=Acidihalobacter aeolianus TaxID=2792603 RepID=A0A1D8K7G8_9GAMM|nr:Mth938-like domain-containing protein [Acidihalobacter aeolianus]AOV16911.1 hypothetical protein BJI67_07400 [Acidihalobacter aeolianus]
MRFTEDSTDAYCIIDAHGSGWVSVNHVIYRHSLIVTPQRIEPWRPAGFSDLVGEDLRGLQDYSPEVILIGTGSCQRFPNAELLSMIRNAEASYEFMDTAAACRTYTILMAEKRLVLAAMLVDE